MKYAMSSVMIGFAMQTVLDWGQKAQLDLLVAKTRLKASRGEDK